MSAYGPTPLRSPLIVDVLYEWSLAQTSEEPPIHDAERRPRLFSSADESSASRLGREGFLRVSDFKKELVGSGLSEEVSGFL